jgi:acyl carrier protein phosphodiesterase
MNFLAHAYLSGNDEHLMVGNFIADFVKGKAALQRYEGGIRDGILLHRVIDGFTDTHPTVALSKNRLREKYRHYSGVIVDVFYDHFLAKNWTAYHGFPLDIFAAKVYDVIEKHFEVVPDQVKNFFPYMKRANWLFNYSKVEGIGRALAGMARRTPYESKMEESTDDLIRFYGEFEKEFKAFFPTLENHVKDYLIKNANPLNSTQFN